ncbi:MAG: TerB family tellurite resistance protein [Candidatus Cloacimonetes bacterium]|nr:TerB family tellurite resistance protein [Candidatus Cloacimonadota bacterium]
MARWENSIESIISITRESNYSIDDFFKPKNYQPKTDEEKHIFEEFSLVTSSMAILINIAEADNILKPEEKEQIINDIIYQLEQRPYELSKLSEKFGKFEKEIILNIYDKMVADYQTNNLNLDKIVDDICLVYQNNPEKRYYLIRLCYYCALADNDIAKAEMDAIQNIAVKMQVPDEELIRIEKEVKLERKNK